MNRTLDDCLAAPDLGAIRTALKTPAAWPLDPARQARLGALGFSPPPSPEPGCTVLASMNDRAAGLWWLEPRAPLRRVDRALRGELAADLRTGRRLVQAALTVAVHWPRAEHAFRASLLAHARPDRVERALGGRSYGLALALATASLALEEPIPAGVVALARIGEDGRLCCVEGFDDKLAMIAAWLPGVSTIVTATKQLDKGPARAEGFDILPVSTLAKAIDAVFPDAEQRVRARWRSDPARARRDVVQLYRQALRGVPGLASWSSVEGAARILEDVLRAEPDLARWARTAGAIAARHEGRGALTPLPAPSVLAAMPRPHRLVLLAHRVQSLADAGETDLEDPLASASAHLAEPGERHAEDLMLLGAVGRAQGRLSPREGIALLREAVLGWLDLLEEHGASRPLCEWMRLAGVLKEGELLAEAAGEPLARVLADERTDELSRAFLHLAAGRAHAQLGRTDEARAFLASDAASWNDAPDHVRAGRLRWLARLPGDPHEAARQRAELAERFPREANRLLADLDAALEAGAPEDPLAALRGLPDDGALVKQALAIRPPECPPARWIAEAFPY